MGRSEANHSQKAGAEYVIKQLTEQLATDLGVQFAGKMYKRLLDTSYPTTPIPPEYSRTEIEDFRNEIRERNLAICQLKESSQAPISEKIDLSKLIRRELQT